MERRLLPLGMALLLVAIAAFGCSSPFAWTGSFWESEDPSTYEGPSEETIAELRRKAKRVGDLTYPWNLNFQKIEAVALVNGLDRTGSSPPANYLRTSLKKEIQRHKVSNVDALLDSTETSMVLVEGLIPPAAKRGDRIDLKVVVAPGSNETESLAGGWMMSAALRPIAFAQNRIREGDVLAEGEGLVLVDAMFEPDPPKNHLQMGRIPGGGIVQRDRVIGVQIRTPDLKGAQAIIVAKAINSRFSATEGTRKIGAAVAKDNRIIGLHIPAEYRGNMARFFEVVSYLGVNESPTERTERLQLLSKQLLEPTTSGRAAIALEGIGREAVAPLEQGLGSPRPEVAFYAAEALAYMDEKAGVETLRKAAKERPTFRWHAISALAAMSHTEAYDALSDLLHDETPETRYGAFRALRLRNENDLYVRGEKIRDEFHFHVVTTLAKPTVHFARRERAEIVVFGHEQKIDNLQQAVFPGLGIMLKPLPGGRVLVSRFAASKSDRRVETSGGLVETMKAVIEVGGGYEELYVMMESLRDAKAWSGELALDALPTPKRASGYNAADATAASTPFPSLFDPNGDSVRRESVGAVKYEGDAEPDADEFESEAAADETAAGSDDLAFDADVDPDEEEDVDASTAKASKTDGGWFGWPSW